MATHLVTGYAGVEHVAAADDATLHASMVGKGKYVFDSGSNFAYEVVSNNLIKIKDGDLMNQGRHIKIAANDYEELEIDNGIAGVKRYDLIVCRYNKDVDTSIESASLVVVKGTSSATPTDPTINSGDIFGGDLVDDFPLYRVCLDGQEIAGVDCLFEVAPNNVGNMAEIGKMKQAINQASKSWIIPDDTTIDVFDIGEPGEKYPVSKYDGKLYLDVASGTVYACSNEEWTVNATLTSVQDKISDIHDMIVMMGVGTDDRESTEHSVLNGISTLPIIHTATEDCIVVFSGFAQYSINTAGVRVAHTVIDNETISANAIGASNMGNSPLNVPFSGVYKLKKSQTLKINLYQNSGSTLTVNLVSYIKVIPLSL